MSREVARRGKGARVQVDITVSMYHRIIMRTTVTLDDDVYEAARAIVQASGKTLGQVRSTASGPSYRL